MKNCKPQKLGISILLAVVLGLVLVFLAAFHHGSSVAPMSIVRQIEQNGGLVTFRYSGPVWLRRLFGRVYPFKTVDTVLLGGASDADLLEAAAFPDLEVLMLNGRKVNGPGLIHLQRLKKLESLDLTKSNITDQDMQYVGALNSLKKLGLSRTDLTDRGLAHLKTLTRLRELDLEGTKVTDEGLHQLAGLPLKELRLRKTAITSDGVNFLTNTIAGVTVVF
jgi:hypothetical protein